MDSSHITNLLKKINLENQGGITLFEAALFTWLSQSSAVFASRQAGDFLNPKKNLNDT